MSEHTALINRLLHIEDCLHFKSLGEVDGITFEWWWHKFRGDSKRESAKRAWARLRSYLRSDSVRHTVDEDSSALMFTEADAVAIRARIDGLLRYPNDAVARRAYERNRRSYLKRRDSILAQKRSYYEAGKAYPTIAEKRRQVVLAWRDGHKVEESDRKKPYSKRYRERNKEKLAAYRKTYYEANKSAAIKQASEWQRRNAARRQSYMAEYRKRQAPNG